MKLVVGLGNPGRRYAATRHNAGARVVARVAERLGIALGSQRFPGGAGGSFGRGSVGGEELALLLPDTWMNESGRAVEAALELAEDPARDLLVVYDDVDLPFGRLRLRAGGGSGGHRGLGDVLERLGRSDVPRLRFGVGRSSVPAETRDWVLEPFSPDEELELQGRLDRAAEAVEVFATEGVETAMGRFNAAEESLATTGAQSYSPNSQRPKPPSMAAMPSQNEQPATPLSSAPTPPLLAERLARPFQRFMDLEISSALLLVAMTVLALVWANSPWAESYFALWQTKAGIVIGDVFSLKLSLGHWVNDGLMVIFFFLVGMEIKREMVEGELSTRARAMLPVMGALGGMIVPAGVYAFFHWGEPTIRGWGIPMATDIAFAVAALSLLGKRVPPGLRIFLLALAIADDIGAVAVIAIFYTAEIHLSALGMAGVGLLVCFALNRAGVRSFLVYIVVGTFVWYEMHHSGVHATIAGVLLGFLTPTALPAWDHQSLVDRGRHAIDRLRELVTGHHDPESDLNDHGGHKRHAVVRELSVVGRETLSPVDFLTNALERWVAFVIMPLFALANAGVALEASTLENAEAQQVALAVGLGLLVGKPIGVSIFSWLAVRGGIAVLPRGVNWASVFATGVLAGIGFTVALFVTALAFGEGVPGAGAKIGILAGSLFATIIGLGILARALPRTGQQA